MRAAARSPVRFGRIERRVRRLGAQVLLFAFLAAWVCAAARAETPDEAARMREQRIAQAQHRSVASHSVRDLAACKSLLVEMLPDLQRSYTREAVLLWAGLVACDARPEGQWRPGLTDHDTVAAAFRPLVAHLQTLPKDQRLKEDLLTLVQYRFWLSLWALGLREEALRSESAWVEPLLAGAAASPPEPLALAGLRMLGRELYGARSRTEWMLQLHQRLSQTLGPGHEVSLLMLRARIFAMRQLERPEQALALSNEYADLVNRHQAGNERLLMGNRSERVGALAGVGRYADARDEGLLLLDYLKRQRPRPHANLMRAAYNLAALAIDMADYDAAVDHAQLSIDEGLQSDGNSISEVALPRLQLQQARLLRGDAGAAEALRAGLASLPSHDLPVVSPAVDLWRHGLSLQDDEIRRWARQLVGEVVGFSALPLQPARAIPLVLDAEATPPGTELGVRAAGEATAQALATGDASVQAMAQFALARQLVPREPAGAAWVYKRAAVSLLRLRQSLPEAAGVAQQAMLASREGELRAFIGLLIDQGRLTEAEQAIEVLREEEVHQFRRRSRGPAVRGQPGPGLSFTADERRRNAQLQPIEQQLRDDARQSQARADQHPRWQDRLAAADPGAQAAVARGAQAVLAIATQPAVRHAARDDGAVTGGPGLAPGRARLAFLVRAQTVEVMLQRGRQRRHLSLPVASATLNREVQALRASLGRPGDAVPPAAQQLHRWLIRPLMPQLAGVRHLQIVPDGALRYLPFAALHDGRQYLVERFSSGVELGTAPTATRVSPAAGVPALAAFGRTLPDAQHDALPGVNDELSVLGALRGARVQLKQDAAFTVASLEDALRGRPAVVHLASHFVLDAAGEEASYLLMGDGHRMSLRQLRELPWQGVRLALLSACDTGISLDSPGAEGRGREWAGFAAALHAAGVPSVVAALWRIDDAGTAAWMREFYTPWQGNAARSGSFKAQQLALAQRRWLQQHRGARLAHPYYWAAFQWMGLPG